VRTHIVGYDAAVSEVDRVWPWAALLRVHAAVVPRLERALAREHMPLAWYDVLLELNSAPDRRLRMTDLSARVVLSRERVSRVVDELEAAGLVRRERNVEDKRSFLAAITPEGRARLRAAAPVYLAGIEEHYAGHLTDDEIRVIGQAFARVLEAEEPGRTSDGSIGRGAAGGRPSAAAPRSAR
jgi:DNA-binding MarR family transcriptional regulator